SRERIVEYRRGGKEAQVKIVPNDLKAERCDRRDRSRGRPGVLLGGRLGGECRTYIYDRTRRREDNDNHCWLVRMPLDCLYARPEGSAERGQPVETCL